MHQLNQILKFHYRPLRSIEQTLQRHQSALQAARHALPDYMRDHCLYCVAKNKRIILFTHSSVWAAQLRFYQTVMIASVNRSLDGNFNSLLVRITPPSDPLPERLRKPRLPSLQTIELLRRTARFAGNDRLKSALLELAASIEKRIAGILGNAR